jgi:hypothetical protein
MRRHSRRACSAAAIAVVAACAAACGSTAAKDTTTTTGAGAATGTGTSSTTGTGAGGAGGAAVMTFSPEGCAFSIASRPEYLGFQTATEVVGATPDIRRVRLGLGGNVAVGAKGRADPSTSIAMAWQTDEGTSASDVTWGTGTDPAQWPAANRASGVTWDTPQGTINAMGNERMHEVYVCGLEPSTTYGYRVGGGPSGGEIWSDVYTFTTTPAGGPTAVKIAVDGDARSEEANAWQILQQHLMTAGVALQLFSGDVINLAPDQGEWEEWLDNAWKDTNGNYSALGQILTLVSHGNHENHTSLFYGNLTLPQDVQNYPQYTELFYSVDVGPLHIVALDDSWIVDPTGDPDYQGIFQPWLEADLGAAVANRANVPWIIAMYHHSSYSSSLHGMDADVLMGRAFFAPIWQKYHVDVVMGGHDHDFERSNPISIGADPSSPTNTTSALGTVYVVSGGAGAPAYSAGTSSWTAISKDTTNGGGIGFYTIVSADAHDLTFNEYELEADGTDTLLETPAFTITK